MILIEETGRQNRELLPAASKLKVKPVSNLLRGFLLINK